MTLPQGQQWDEKAFQKWYARLLASGKPDPLVPLFGGSNKAQIR